MLLAKMERRIQASENMCLRRSLQILYGEQRTNDFLGTLVGHQKVVTIATTSKYLLTRYRLSSYNIHRHTGDTMLEG